MKEAVPEKEGISPKVIFAISAAVIAALIGFVIFRVRASDPASRGPIPYKKFDYAAQVHEQGSHINRQTGPGAGTSR